MKKTIMTVIFSVMCVAACLLMSPAACADYVASGSCGDNLIWRFDSEGLLTISGSGEMEDYTSSYPPYSSPPWQEYCSSISSVKIDNGVTSLGSGAFYGCSGLADSEGFVIVRNVLFSYYGGTTAVIPSGVKSISSSAFYDCSGLTSVTIPSSVTSIGDYAFSGCSSLTSVTIPSSVTRIGDYAFSSCSSLTSVTIPSSVTSIGKYAFDGCRSLTSVTIPSSMTRIENDTFNNCSSLTSVTIPEGVTSIGESVFYDCTGLKTAGSIGSGCNVEFGWTTAIPASAFESSSLTSVTIPDGVTSIGKEAFNYCYSLTSVTIPSSVTSIGSSAFHYCSGLETVGSVGSGCNIELGWTTVIPDSAFYYCTSLRSVTIPSSVTSIGAGAFWNCDFLTSVTIPSSVTSIGDYAFSGCSSLTDVYYEGSQEQWAAISKDQGNDPLDVATIHYNTVIIPNPDLILPASLKTIEEEAFSGGAFVYVKLPEGTETIQARAFADSPNLKYIYIPESTTAIDGTAFENVTNLTILGKQGSSAENYAAANGFAFRESP